jgi:hypothetical protein
VTPEPRDLLRAARATLAEVVLPALTDAFAVEQAGVVLRVLVHLEAVIDDAYALEWEEARDLAELLAQPAPTPAGAPPPSYRALRDANVARKRELVERIRAASAAGTELGAPLAEYVRRQTERERRWSRPKPNSSTRGVS